MLLHGQSLEVKIMGRKKRMRLLNHKEGFKRILSFNLRAQEAKMGQPLAPILGQVQITVSDFVTYFNQKTIDFPKGFKLKVRLYVKWDKSYFIEIEKISFTLLTKSLLYHDISSRYETPINLPKEDIDTYSMQGNTYVISFDNFRYLVNVYSVQYSECRLKSIKVVFGILRAMNAHIVLYKEQEMLHIRSLRAYMSLEKMSELCFSN